MNIELIKLQIKHYTEAQQLARIPEPTEVSNGTLQTRDYSKSKDSLIIVPYLVALGMIDKICPPAERSTALELCSGPGNFTNLLNRLGGFKNITGVDLSEKMIALAQKNNPPSGVDNTIKFFQDDVTKLKDIPQTKVDLVTFMNGAHHLNSLNDVKATLLRADDLAHSDGSIFIMDPVRPKTIDLANRYIKIFGADYIAKSLLHFHKDFRDSVFASWTADEFKSTIPKNTKRTWIHILPFGFPAFQFIVGLPVGRKNLWFGQGVQSSEIKKAVPKAYLTDYRLFQLAIFLGKNTIVS